MDRKVQWLVYVCAFAVLNGVLTLPFAVCSAKSETPEEKLPAVVGLIADEKCLKPTEAGDGALKNMGIELVGGTSEQRDLAKRTVATLESRLGPKSKIREYLANSKIEFVSELQHNVGADCEAYVRKISCTERAFGFPCGGGSQKTGGMCKNPPAASAALMAHEMGHLVMMYQPGLRKQEYERNVTSRCIISSYCTHNKNASGQAVHGRDEEAAEVFAAFIFAPDQLRKKCEKAFNYMTYLFGGLRTDTKKCKATNFEIAWRDVGENYQTTEPPPSATKYYSQTSNMPSLPQIPATGGKKAKREKTYYPLDPVIRSYHSQPVPPIPQPVVPWGTH